MASFMHECEGKCWDSVVNVLFHAVDSWWSKDQEIISVDGQIKDEK